MRLPMRRSTVSGTASSARSSATAASSQEERVATATGRDASQLRVAEGAVTRRDHGET